MSVLLVDDDEVFLDFMQSQLDKIGAFRVSRALSATEALEIVKSSEVAFDCFLLDIDMPGMDGIELCRELRQKHDTSGVPIIMVTVLSAVEKMDLAFSAGASDYINKPMVKTELRGRMQMALAKLTEQKAKAALISSIVYEAPRSVNDSVIRFNHPCIVDREAMENYAFRLGSDELCRRTLFGLNVTNIQQIFASKDGASFKAILLDLAEEIIDALGSGHKMISYVGSGDFVVILGEHVTYDASRLFERLSSFVCVFEGRGRAFGEIVPSLKIGPPVNGELFSCVSPDELICIASGLARDIGDPVEAKVLEMV